MAKSLLERGASATQMKEDSPSALHWLAAFRDDQEIVDITNLLLRNGAILDCWVDDEDDLLLGKVHGTPLHWSIWYHNMSAIRILTKLDPKPCRRNFERAVFLASALHFYDVLSLLNDWSRSKLSAPSSGIDMNSALMLALKDDVCGLVRLLRHDQSTLTRDMLETFDILFEMHEFSKADADLIHVMVMNSILQNNAEIFRFFVVRLDLIGRKERLKDKIEA